MPAFQTVGQPAATAAARAMLATHVPHAVLLVGPPSVGKLSLALDISAALLCTGATGDDRPCGSCRGCRMVAHGNHPDLHRLDPEGPGGQVGIGGQGRPRGVRDLVTELALLPVEGGARVAIVRDAHRMNDDAQSALLKTLEEPPDGTTLILCADDEDRLLPTVRSRCARIRLGTLGIRDVERLLADRGLADPPTAARLARLAAGRAGLAIAYATAPEAATVRGVITRTLIDLADRGPADRLGAARDLMAQATMLGSLLAPAGTTPAEPPPRRGRARTAAITGPVAPEPAAEGGPAGDGAPAGADTGATEGSRRAPAVERRRALGLLLEAWRDLARDLALSQAGGSGSVRDPALLEELANVSARTPTGAFGRSLGELVRAGDLLEANVSPELLLDVLLLHWPRASRPG